MALFKILRGSSDKFKDEKLRPTFNDGYCYFVTGTNMFYVDYEDENGNEYRVPLNAQNANTLSLSNYDNDNQFTGYTEGYELVDFLSANRGQVPTSSAVYAKTFAIETDVQDLQNNKMDKVNPTGSGILSINRFEGTIIGEKSASIGGENTASGNYSFATGFSTSAVGEASHSEGYNTDAGGKAAHVEGINSLAPGEASHSEGYGSISEG
jgi:hypothetical protein